MDREIKFRGKDIDTGEWVYGYVVQNFTNKIFILTGDDENIHDNLYGKVFSTRCFREVVPETVGQYIDLKDKNNKEIYEGDILLHDDGNWGYGGEYDKKHDGYLRTLIPNIEDLLKEYPDYFTDEIQTWEKVGNIYDNPKLIEK